MSRALKALRLALAFLTVLPIPFRDSEIHEADLAASRFAYPVVGVLIGLVLAGLHEGLARGAIAAPLRAFLLLAAGVLLTGGLHLDGLADTCDGLFLWGGPERRLAVMRDPHIGSFGATGLLLVLLGKYAALVSLESGERTLALLGGAVASRSGLLVMAGLAPYARPEGTGRIVVA
ncbi:MAG: adenosylcobinamide-GDP ribazoletransferase, partial [Isosphaeraceae bacterium]|nr:adenosylcobinamide-GDP ribazoletransferase [Isosphaeraceae bacterium]